MSLRTALFAAALALSPAALAKPAATDDGLPLRVVVTDTDGKPIPTAVVRNPLEADRHRVNAVDGSWSDSVFYLPDGSEQKFAKGMVIELEISAPGFANQHIQYAMRKRNNEITVPLTALQVTPDDDGGDDVTVGFGHDVPIDGQ